MTTLEAHGGKAIPASAALFAVTVFCGAALVFLVEPMVVKLVLPLLGGGPSIWNTSLAFFQAALLVGYGYAHLLQRISSVRAQVAVHCAVLIAAGLVLPLGVSDLFGPPSSDHPALWLIGVLAVSLGPPFAALSATAPLVQAWHARAFASRQGKEPYALYAASNLGSLLALLAYPILVEPLASLHQQSLGWSLGYGGFVAIMVGLGLYLSRRPMAPPAAVTLDGAETRIGWRERLTWMALAAIPSSLMLGVTGHITTDVASAPFLWVAPLALYLLTFIIAFQTKPAIPPGLALLFQAAAIAACAMMLPFKASDFVVQLAVHLICFFFTALICHQALVSRRPAPAKLTEFYLWMSIGGVVGGGFNAFLAPVIFNSLWEYPLMLALSCLARPWGEGRFTTWNWATFLVSVAAAVAAPIITTFYGIGLGVQSALAAAMVGAFIVRRRAFLFFGAISVLIICATAVGGRVDVRENWRSFFGVVRESRMPVPALGGEVKMLAHGSTLHGAQAIDPRWRCRPLVYYAPETPIGQVFTAVQARKPAARIGAVGLGTGAVAAYVRPADHLTFFEIDPLVIRISTDPKHFSYTSECAKGPVDFVVGDARLTLAHQRPATFDILLIDAFSSDSVPAHLLTVEAVRGYLTLVKPDGVLILHLSNRNLELTGPAMAVAAAAGGHAFLQQHRAPQNSPPMWQSSEDALIIGHTAQALAGFAADPRWEASQPNLVRPWTDDYINLPGALYRQLKVTWTWLP
ncbi:spermidine synthase [Phenylobacterium sp.]|uniref:spermidine synthase n=1 Tax=Phenylobacterium sp. TaxID=1871053 RepID=UPI002735AD0B|nr:spermidine synthase [Phenylobacterium sp.]MDP3659368.1 spermidine synthase [Phenylobacterium sp.]